MWLFLTHELKIKAANISDWLYPAVFFVLVLVLFPIATGAEKKLLTYLGVPAVWIAALLAMLLNSVNMFTVDISQGHIEQLIVARVSLTLWVMMKLLVHWLTSGFLLVIISVLVMPLFGLSAMDTLVLMLSLLIGTPILLLFSSFAAALTISLPAANALVPIIALPLQLPVLIFATGLLERFQQGFNILPTLALLLAILIFCIMLLPWATAYVLRFACD